MSKRAPMFRKIRRRERSEELWHEAVIGIVTDNKDPEKLARVKVKFPTLGDDASDWATMSALGAGKDRGWFFLPEIDDEVLVMFAHGDFARPVIVGALWNGKDKPPESNGGGNERRVLISREGHKVEFDDDAGTITFEDGGGEGKVVISDDKIEATASSGDCSTQSPKGDTSIIANDVKMKGSMSADLKAGGDMKISGSKIKIEGGSMLKVNGSKVEIQPGGTPEAAKAEGEPAEVPDRCGG